MRNTSFYNFVLFLFFTFQILEIRAQKRSKRNTTIESVNYDKKKDFTIYSVFPFGTVNLKGKWDEVQFNNVSKQKTFRNADNIELLICINDCKNYEFNSDPKVSNENFVERFYTWEKEFFEQNPNLKVSIIEKDTTNNYLIWNINGKLKDQEVDTILLIAEKNCNIKTISIFKTKLLTTETRIKLIKETFENH